MHVPNLRSGIDLGEGNLGLVYLMPGVVVFNDGDGLGVVNA